MSSMRRDPSQRPGPVGWSKVRSPGESREDEARRGGAAGVPVDHRAGQGRGGQLAATGRRDRPGIPPPLRAEGPGADARRVRDPRGRRRVDRRHRGRPARAARGLSRAAADHPGEQRGPVGGHRGGLPRGPGRVGGDPRRRPPERPGRPGEPLGRPPRPRRGARLAGQARGRLVEADHQPMGQPRPQRGPRPVDPRHRLLGPHLLRGGWPCGSPCSAGRTGSSARS